MQVLVDSSSLRLTPVDTTIRIKDSLKSSLTDMHVLQLHDTRLIDLLFYSFFPTVKMFFFQILPFVDILHSSD